MQESVHHYKEGWHQTQQGLWHGRLNTSCGMAGKGVPVALTQGVEAKLVCDLSSIHGIWQILLVGKYQQDCVTQLLLRGQQVFSHRAQLALMRKSVLYLRHSKATAAAIAFRVCMCCSCGSCWRCNLQSASKTSLN